MLSADVHRQTGPENIQPLIDLADTSGFKSRKKLPKQRIKLRVVGRQQFVDLCVQNSNLLAAGIEDPSVSYHSGGYAVLNLALGNDDDAIVWYHAGRFLTHPLRHLRAGDSPPGCFAVLILISL